MIFPYYYRTWLRERLPWRLIWLAPRRRHCPPWEHQWYAQVGRRWACYHCQESRIFEPERIENCRRAINRLDYSVLICASEGEPRAEETIVRTVLGAW